MGIEIDTMVARGNAAASLRTVILDVSAYTRLVIAGKVHVETGGPKTLSATAKIRAKAGGRQVAYQSSALSGGVETLSDWSMEKACADASQTGFYISFDVEGLDEMEIVFALASGAAADYISLEAVGS